MKERIKLIKYWPWFKILIILAIFIYLLIQWGNFNVARFNASIYCQKTASNDEICLKIFSLKNLLKIK